MNHGITTTDVDSGETPYGGGEFIGHYVFPQGELPQSSLVLQPCRKAAWRRCDVENLRRHYARTCGIWADNFEARADEIETVVDDKRFRIWRVYLAGCAYAFDQDWISLYQVVCGKAGASAAACPGRADTCTADECCTAARFSRLILSAKVFLNFATLGATTKAQ